MNQFKLFVISIGAKRGPAAHVRRVCRAHYDPKRDVDHQEDLVKGVICSDENAKAQCDECTDIEI